MNMNIRIMANLPKNHCSTMGSGAGQRQFGIKEVRRIKSKLVFSMKWIHDLGDIVLEGLRFTDKGKI